LGKPEVITIYVQRSSGLFQNFAIPASRNISILEALYYIWEHLDPSLAFTYACRIGLCGSCLVQANGHPVLACMTFAEDGMRIGPAEGFKQIRDTVVELKHEVPHD
jgi:succinate dehydrogenase/fumarate reductase-like Fe-S protein